MGGVMSQHRVVVIQGTYQTGSAPTPDAFQAQVLLNNQTSRQPCEIQRQPNTVAKPDRVLCMLFVEADGQTRHCAGCGSEVWLFEGTEGRRIA